MSADVWTLREEKLLCEHHDELAMICRRSHSTEQPKVIAFIVETTMLHSEITGPLRTNVSMN
ncbi:hypothetical protein HNP29_000111 [Pseudomonas alcaligenes]|nr:hypothetical protein [Pseudomonas alcaligenes]